MHQLPEFSIVPFYNQSIHEEGPHMSQTFMNNLFYFKKWTRQQKHNWQHEKNPMVSHWTLLSVCPSLLSIPAIQQPWGRDIFQLILSSLSPRREIAAEPEGKSWNKDLEGKLLTDLLGLLSYTTQDQLQRGGISLSLIQKMPPRAWTQAYPIQALSQLRFPLPW